MSLTSKDLRKKYLDFFTKQNHAEVISASTIPDSDDQTVLFTTAGMQQFVPNLMGKPHPQGNRLMSVQKCVRTVDIDEVGDNRHLTFFEMLGNWSLGDYFKNESIEWSYNFLIHELNIPKEKLWVTVYGGDEKLKYDQKSHDIWLKMGMEEKKIVGIGAPTDPEKRRRKGRGDNFWAAGATGPCGPSSELFIWLGQGEPKEGQTPETDEDNFIEVWNNVFMAYEQIEGGELKALAQKNVDTGMGLERLTMIIQGKTTVFETDIYDSIIAEIENISGKKYPPYAGDLDENNPVTRAFRVIADHVRCSTHLIADGVAASNEGRGYVLRRLLRRAVRFAKNLEVNFDTNFLEKIAAIYIDEYAEFYPEISERKQVVFSSLQIEEENFLRTLEKGEKKLDDILDDIESGIKNTKYVANRVISDVKKIHNTIQKGSEDVRNFTKKVNSFFSGVDAFLLSDTYGFPKDLTREIVEEKGFKIEEEEFNKEFDAELKAQRERSRANQNFEMKGQGNEVFDDLPATKFVGDTGNQLENMEATVLACVDDGKGKYRIAVDKTPFYAESGGQVGDRGVIVIPAEAGISSIQITDTKKLANGVFVHYGECVGGDLCVSPNEKNKVKKEYCKNNSEQGDHKGTPLQKGQNISLSVDTTLRKRTTRHHSAAHLLQSALLEVLGDGIEQAGSLVDENRTRFDFSYPKALSNTEIRKVEEKIAEYVFEAYPIEVQEMTMNEAKEAGAIALFSEKYGDTVRTVRMGEPSFELCGGTHVQNTSEIGAVKIISESSVASGVRRIEMVVGIAAQQYFLNQSNDLENIAGKLKTPLDRVEERIIKLVEEKKELESEVKNLSGKLLGFEAEEFFMRKKEVPLSPPDKGDIGGLSENGDKSPQPPLSRGSRSIICEPIPTYDLKKVGGMARALSSKKVDIVALFTEDGGIAIATQRGGINARDIFEKIKDFAGGNGGGSPFFVQGKGVELESFQEIRKIIENVEL